MLIKNSINSVNFILLLELTTCMESSYLQKQNLKNPKNSNFYEELEKSQNSSKTASYLVTVTVSVL